MRGMPHRGMGTKTRPSALSGADSPAGTPICYAYPVHFLSETCGKQKEKGWIGERGRASSGWLSGLWG